MMGATEERHNNSIGCASQTSRNDRLLDRRFGKHLWVCTRSLSTSSLDGVGTCVDAGNL